jgi:hypothetical protein
MKPGIVVHPVILALGRQRQKDFFLLFYYSYVHTRLGSLGRRIESSRPA